MRRGRMMTGFASLGVAALLAPAAFSATPSEIAADLADGRIDGKYTQAELQAYLQNAVVQGYGEPTRPPVITTTVTPPQQTVLPPQVAGAQSPPQPAPAVKTAATPPAEATPQVAGVQTPPAVEETRTVDTLPFTGLDLVLLVVGGMLLLALGLGARRLGHQRA